MGTEATLSAGRGRSLAWSLARLARPHQWTKSVFVFVGPAYGLTVTALPLGEVAWRAMAAAGAFAFASSACYVVNDLLDAEQDRAHPRKSRRPIASGAVSPRQALALAVGLALLAGLCLIPLPGAARFWTGAAVIGYVVNVVAYSAWLKHAVIADVMSLALGFVIRVLGGCAAAMVAPSAWLLNCTLFLAMFLAFGKRLGERRSLGDRAVAARRVQGDYTDTFLQMAVVVTGVATLVGYMVYIAGRDPGPLGLSALWLTVLPATYGMFRAMVLLDGGRFDDPTELAVSDRPFQASALLFGAISAGALGYDAIEKLLG